MTTSLALTLFLLLFSHVQLFLTPWSVVHWVPLSMGFPRQEYWMGCHFLLQGIFLTQGWNPHVLHWQVDSLSLSHLGSPYICVYMFTHTHTHTHTHTMWPSQVEMVTHSNILTWEITWTEEPGGLQSRGHRRVGHDWVTEHICAYISELFCCTPETNTTL